MNTVHLLTHTHCLSLSLLNSPFTPFPVSRPLGFPSYSKNRLHSGLGSAMSRTVRAAVKLICVYYLVFVSRSLSHTHVVLHTAVLIEAVASFPLKSGI